MRKSDLTRFSLEAIATVSNARNKAQQGPWKLREAQIVINSDYLTFKVLEYHENGLHGAFCCGDKVFENAGIACFEITG